MSEFKEERKLARGTKVADEDGLPLMVFRGTGEGEDDRSERKFWTEDKEVAAGYARCSDGESPHIFSAYLNIRKMMDLDNDKHAKRLADRLGREFSADNPRWELIDDPRAAAAVFTLGFDGLVFQDLNTSNGDEHLTYVSLTSDQLIHPPEKC